MKGMINFVKGALGVGGLYKFYKFILCWCNTLNIKSIFLWKMEWFINFFPLLPLQTKAYRKFSCSHVIYFWSRSKFYKFNLCWCNTLNIKSILSKKKRM